MSTDEFISDVRKLFRWASKKNIGHREHPRIKGFFSKIFREMKR